MKAFNFITMTEYGGRNALLEGNGDLPAFASFNQLRDSGYMVKKGAKSVSIFCGYRQRKDKTTGKMTTVPTSGRVFDIIDTTAADDKGYIKHLKAEIKKGRVKPSPAEAEAMAGAAVMEALTA
jgi:tRNA splicing endonuclease